MGEKVLRLNPVTRYSATSLLALCTKTEENPRLQCSAQTTCCRFPDPLPGRKKVPQVEGGFWEERCEVDGERRLWVDKSRLEGFVQSSPFPLSPSSSALGSGCVWEGGGYSHICNYVS